MSRKKEPPTTVELPPNGNGNGHGWSAWWKTLAFAAIAAVVALMSILYWDARGQLSDLGARVQRTEIQQAVSDQSKVQLESELRDVKSELKEVNRKLDALLTQRVVPAK